LALEKANFKALFERYEILLKEEGDEGSDIAETTQQEIFQGLLDELSDQVRRFTIEPDMPTDETRNGLVDRIAKQIQPIFANHVKLEIAPIHVKQTEILLITIRELIARTQELVILSETMNKINSFHHTISEMEIILEIDDRQTRAQISSSEAQEFKNQSEALAKSDSATEKSMARFIDLLANSAEKTAELETGISNEFIKLETSLSKLMSYYNEKSDQYRALIGKLASISHYLRTNHSTIVLEAGNQNAIFTENMVDRLTADLREVEETHTGFKNYYKKLT